MTKSIGRRLNRLEEFFLPMPESPHTRSLRLRLEAARRRCGIPPLSQKRATELMGKSIVEILHLGGPRAANRSNAQALLSSRETSHEGGRTS